MASCRKKNAQSEFPWERDLLLKLRALQEQQDAILAAIKSMEDAIRRDIRRLAEGTSDPQSVAMGVRKLLGHAADP
jgi:hypothetical protein